MTWKKKQWGFIYLTYDFSSRNKRKKKNTQTNKQTKVVLYLNRLGKKWKEDYEINKDNNGNSKSNDHYKDIGNRKW